MLTQSAVCREYAGMAELADALDSGSNGRKAVQVQVLLPAPSGKGLESFRAPGLFLYPNSCPRPGWFQAEWVRQFKKNHKGRKTMQKVVYISNSRDYTEQNDINDNKYLVRINKLLEDGWAISQMNTQTVDVDPKLENYLHKETLVSFVILEKPGKDE